MAEIYLFTPWGAPAGTYEVPDDVMEAANRVADWMTANRVRSLCGLTLSHSEEFLRSALTPSSL